jgi:hypothetical protein
MPEENDTNIKPEGNEHINLKVTGQDGSVVQFKIKHKTPLRKLMSAYCDRAESIVFYPTVVNSNRAKYLVNVMILSNTFRSSVFSNVGLS